MKVSSYSLFCIAGSYSLSVLNSTRIKINPDCDESKALYVWYREKRPSIDVKRITTGSMGGDSSGILRYNLFFVAKL